MNKLFLALIISFFLASCATVVSNQTADEAYKLQNYHTASKMYERLFRSGKTMEAKGNYAFKAGECYNEMNDWKEAEQWYQKADALGYRDPVLYYKIAEMLKQQGKYDGALKYYEIFKREAPGDSRADEGIASVSLYHAWKNDKARFVVAKDEKLSSTENDYAPAYLADESKIAITSDRRGSTGDKIYERTGKQFSDIYIADWDFNKKEWGTPVKAPGAVNTEFNEGVTDFIENPDEGTLMYYTQCNGPKGEEKNCKILVSLFKDGEWKKPDALPFCDDTAANFGHPAFTSDGRTLYFASSKEGGYGNRDLYKISYNPETGKWGTPQNLGPKINSKGDEMFPFVFQDSVLYFSSDGLPGIGGMDVFEVSLNKPNAKPRNLKPPINSSGDDISFVFDKKGDKGYLSSNRDGKVDNIYYFYLKPKVCALAGVVKNSKTKKPVSGALITLYSKEDEAEPVTVQADKNGAFFMSDEFDCDKLYEVQAKKEGFFASVREELNTHQVEVSDTFKTELLIEPYPVTSIKLEGIYYGLDSFNLRKESLPVLDSLTTVMKENPGLVVELASHTDCRASMSYNDTLSQKRAQSVVNYLVGKGINKERLVAKGYGERMLVNDCACENGEGKGINCTEEQHQQNRRTTFKILRTDFGDGK